MQTFKQYFLDESGMMTPDRVPNKLASMIQNTVLRAELTAKAAARGKADEQQLQSTMAQLSKAHKMLDKYSSEDLKRKIVDKYNLVRVALEQQPSVESITDCVQHFKDIYNVLVG